MSSIILEVAGGSPLERQIVHDGERYIADCMPPVENISKEDYSKTNFIEAVELRFYNNKNLSFNIGRVDKKQIIAFVKAEDDREMPVNIKYFDTDAITVVLEYLKSIQLISFAESLKNAYFNDLYEFFL